ncbi:MAG: YihY/virulence factor BrkB family protein [Actinomycetota bacterium]
MPWTTTDKVMQIREKNHVIDVLVETLDGWRLHLSGRNASLLSFFAFLSIFPLLLAATTILGFVLEGNPTLRDELIEGALSEIPVLGEDLKNDPEAISGSWLVLIIGLGGALWSSTKGFVGLQGALDDIWEVHVDDRAKMPQQRGRALLGIAILGGAQVGNVVLANIVSQTNFPAVGDIAIIAGTVLINIVTIGAMYRFLTSANPTWTDVLPGAVIAGIVFSLLQHFGTAIVTRITENAGDTYGQFALVLGIVTWLGLVAITTLMCAELNAAIVRLRGGPTLPDRPEFQLSVTA